MEVNSNTPPFPLARLIELNSLLPLNVSFPAETVMSALLFVADVEEQLMVIPFNTRLAVPVIETRDVSDDSCALTVIVNAFNVCSPALADSMHAPLLTLTTVDSLDDSQYPSIVTFDETLNPVVDVECVAV